MKINLLKKSLTVTGILISLCFSQVFAALPVADSQKTDINSLKSFIGSSEKVSVKTSDRVLYAGELRDGVAPEQEEPKGEQT